jgi:hypothetical protein
VKNLLPNFICPGAQKSATTTLHDILIQHPDIYLPENKETHFFDKDEKYDKGIDFYLNEFYSEIKNEKIIGDITPGYMFFEDSVERIYNTLGDNIKIIFMLRNPIERAYSHYWMSYRRTYENKTFEKAIELEKGRIKKDYFNRSHYSYIERGYYARQIKRFLEFFPKENMKFVIFEYFINDTENSIEDVLSFLDLDYDYYLKLNKKSNAAFLPKFRKVTELLRKPPDIVKKIGSVLPIKIKSKIVKTVTKINQEEFDKPKMKTATKEKLLDIFYEDIKELESIINKDLDLWYDNSKNNLKGRN